jgi:GDP/UDP-N,N'-diacetylbacillosamine 2-epimerase (hydrolysing)
MKIRTIAVVTGTRSEFGILRPILRAIQDSQNFRLQLIVTGMHLMDEFGSTVHEIEKEFKIAARVPMPLSTDTSQATAHSLAEGIRGMTDALVQLLPDILLVPGDRSEAFAAAIAGMYARIPIAHLHGGDVSGGGFDEFVRHAITKMSHIHFAASPKSAERIIRMGENPSNVFIVGAPGLDTILGRQMKSKKDVEALLGIDLSLPTALVVQHSISVHPETAGDEMLATLAAVDELGLQAVVLYPNSDSGHQKIIAAIQRYEKNPRFRVMKSIGHEYYLSIMSNAHVMVGNSSSGIIEASSFHLPVVNIGERQEGRERAENVIDVPPEKERIKDAIKTCFKDEAFRQRARNCVNPYGSGNAGQRIAEILGTISLEPGLLQKKLAY